MVVQIMASFYEITFAWEDRYRGLIMKDPKLLKLGAEVVVDSVLYRYDGEALIRVANIDSGKKMRSRAC